MVPGRSLEEYGNQRYMCLSIRHSSYINLTFHSHFPVTEIAFEPIKTQSSDTVYFQLVQQNFML